MRRGVGHNRICGTVAMLMLPCICLLLLGAPGLARVLNENRTLVISGGEALSPWYFLENCEDSEPAAFPYENTQEAMLSVLSEEVVAEGGEQIEGNTEDESQMLDGNADGTQAPDGSNEQNPGGDNADGNSSDDGETGGDGEVPDGDNIDGNGGETPDEDNTDGNGGETPDGDDTDGSGGETPGGDNTDGSGGETPDGDNTDGNGGENSDGNDDNPDGGDVINPATGKELELLYMDDEVVVLSILWPAESDSLYLCGGTGAWEEGMRYSTDGYQGYRLSASGAIELEAGARVLFIERPHNTDTILGIFHDEEQAQVVASVSLAEATEASWSFELTAGSRVLGEDGKMVWTCKGELADGRLLVERQVLGAEGYEAFADEEHLPMTETRSEGKVEYAIANPKEHLAPAGTYRLLVTQFATLEDGTEVALMQMELSYFVNYR